MKSLQKKIILFLLFVTTLAFAQDDFLTVASDTVINLEGQINVNDSPPFRFVSYLFIEGNPFELLSASPELNIYFPGTTAFLEEDIAYSFGPLNMGNASFIQEGRDFSDPDNLVYTYEWGIDKFSPTTTNSLPTVGEDYIIAVTSRLTNITFARAFIDVVDDPTLSVEEFSKEKTISFYPNPATSTITLGDNIVTETYKAVNLSGAVVMETAAISNTLDVSSLANGMYLLVTDSGIAKFVKK